jgi:hypothetical protein
VRALTGRKQIEPSLAQSAYRWQVDGAEGREPSAEQFGQRHVLHGKNGDTQQRTAVK